MFQRTNSTLLAVVALAIGLAAGFFVGYTYTHRYAFLQDGDEVIRTDRLTGRVQISAAGEPWEEYGVKLVRPTAQQVPPPERAAY